MLYLPPLARLPEIIGCLDEMIAILARALAPAARFERKRGDVTNDLTLAVAVHAINALHAARAIRVLAEEKMGNSLYPHGRIIYEALVKIQWMRLDSARATRYLQSESFNRYRLLRGLLRQPPHFPQVMADCRAAIAGDPTLLSLVRPKQNAIGPPNYYKLLGVALRMPKMTDMIIEIGMDEEDYFVDYAFPSQQPHSSPTHTKNFAKRVNSDDMARISTDESNDLLVSYSARALPHIGNVVVQVLSVFPDGAIEYDAEKCAARINNVVDKMRATGSAS
jgi:hypothetical protein